MFATNPVGAYLMPPPPMPATGMPWPAGGMPQRLAAAAVAGGYVTAPASGNHPPLFKDMMPCREVQMLLPYPCTPRIVCLTKGQPANYHLPQSDPNRLTKEEVQEFQRQVQVRRSQPSRASHFELGSHTTWFPHRDAALAMVYVYEWSLDYHNSEYNGFQTWQYATSMQVQDVGELATLPNDDVWFIVNGLERFRQKLWGKNIRMRAGGIDRHNLWVVTGDNSQVEAALGCGVQLYVLTPHYGNKGRKEARRLASYIWTWNI